MKKTIDLIKVIKMLLSTTCNNFRFPIMDEDFDQKNVR